jgi:hypothetical protein
VPEQIDSTTDSHPQPSAASSFSGEACDLLAATVRDYLDTGRVPDELARVTARLCQEAQARGLSAEETLTEIRATLGMVLARCALTSSDRAGLVAMAIGECVHAFYRDQH